MLPGHLFQAASFAVVLSSWSVSIRAGLEASFRPGRSDGTGRNDDEGVVDGRLLAVAVGEPVLGRLTGARLGGGTEAAATGPVGRGRSQSGV